MTRPVDSADAAEFRNRDDDWPTRCMRHPSVPAKAFGLCRSCSAGLSPYEVIDEATDLRAEQRRR
jgi:hypothetical protein